jgi:glycosyltransferase involved in cell wall biosynthesis
MLSVVIPAYNEEENVPILYEKLKKVLDGLGQDYEIIFVDEGSTWPISKITGVHLHDYGCTLKAYRAEVLKYLELFGDMHRFLPALTKRGGAKITEVVVRYHPRMFGRSKYGIGRTVRVLLDIMLVKFLNEYINKPLYMFGSVGFLLLGLGLFSLFYLIFLKLFLEEPIGRRPLLILSVLLILAGIQLISTGLLAELLVRIYYRTKDAKPYVIQEKINLE